MNVEGISVGIEHIPQLVEIGKMNVMKNYSYLIKEKKIILVEGDGRNGYKPMAPYNCIHVGAGKQIFLFFQLQQKSLKN